MPDISDSVIVKVGVNLSDLTAGFAKASTSVKDWANATVAMADRVANTGRIALGNLEEHVTAMSDAIRGAISGMGKDLDLDAVRQIIEAANEEIASMRKALLDSGLATEETDKALATFSDTVQDAASEGIDAAIALRDVADATEEAGDAAGGAEPPVTDLGDAYKEVEGKSKSFYDNLRAYRSEQVQQGRMARFMAGELLSVVPASAGAKAGIQGMLGILIQGATAGLGFGLALEGLKFIVGSVTEKMEIAEKATRDWATSMQSHAWAARDAFDDFARSLRGPEMQIEGMLRGITSSYKREIREQEKIVLENQVASGWRKLWAVITPGDDHFQRMDRAREVMRKLKEEWDNALKDPEITKLRNEEIAREEQKLGRELITARVALQSEETRIEMEHQQALANLRASTPDEVKGTQQYKDKEAAMSEAAEEKKKRLRESRALQAQQLELRAAMLGADQRTKIEKQAAADIAAIDLQIAQARRTEDAEEIALLRLKKRERKASRDEELRLLTEQQARAAQTFALEREVAAAQQAAGAQEAARLREVTDLQTRLVGATGAEREAILSLLNAGELEAIAAKRAGEDKVRLAQENLAMAQLEAQLADAIRKDKEGSNQKEIDLIFDKIKARQEDYAQWKLVEAAKRGDEDAKRRLEEKRAAEGPSKKGERDALAAARDARATELQEHLRLLAAQEISKEEYERRVADTEQRYAEARLASQGGWLGQMRDAWSGVTSSLASNWASGIAQMIEGGYRFGEFWTNLGRSMLGAFAQTVASMLQGWIGMVAKKTAVWIAGLFTEQKATATVETAKTAVVVPEAATRTAAKAGEAAAGAGAAVAPTPWIGPALAISAAAAVFAGLIGYMVGQKKSAAGGYDIPAGVNPVVQAHAEEMVLPAKYAKPLRALLAKAGEDGDGLSGGGSGMPPIAVSVNAMDGASVMRVLRSQDGQSALVTAVMQAIRDGRLGLATK